MEVTFETIKLSQEYAWEPLKCLSYDIGETILMASMFAVRLNQLLMMYFDLVGHLLSKLHLSRTVSECLHRFHHSSLQLHGVLVCHTAQRIMMWSLNRRKLSCSKSFHPTVVYSTRNSQNNDLNPKIVILQTFTTKS